MSFTMSKYIIVEYHGTHNKELIAGNVHLVVNYNVAPNGRGLGHPETVGECIW